MVFQNQQFELDLLNERGKEVLEQANPGNVKKINSLLSAISKEWRELIANLEARRSTLEALSKHWEELESRWSSAETKLNAMEERSKIIDMIVRSKQHLLDSTKAINVSKIFEQLYV